MYMKMKLCAACCLACRTRILQTMQLCLKRGGKLADARLQLMLSECAQLCLMTADMAAVDSERCAAIAEACAKECEACARACEAMPESALKECADALRECAAGCRSLLDAVSV
jgi:hypothetical protein